MSLARWRKSLDSKNVTLEVGDAFDRAALAALTPRATIGIVSGTLRIVSVE